MASFQDKFSRADELDLTVTSADWSGDTGKIELKNRFVQNTDGTAGRARYTGTTPGTENQSISAYATCTTENANSYIDIGVHAPDTSEGIWARLTWSTSGVRTLSIMYRVGDEGSDTTARTLTMIATGGVVQTGYDGFLIQDGAVNVLQHLRLVVMAGDEGLIAAVYVNQPDDDKPTLMERLRSDAIDTGTWFFGFGANSTASSLRIAEISGEDYAHPDSKRVTQHPGWPTLEAVRDALKRRYQRAINSNIPDKNLNEAILFAHQEILNEVGDILPFLVRHEQRSISFDTDGFATMPRYMARVLLITEQRSRRDANIHFDHFADTGGDIVVRRDFVRDRTSGTFNVRYLVRHELPREDWEQIAFPREHMQLLIAAAARMIAEQDRSATWEASSEKRYQQLLDAFKRDMNRYEHYRKTSITPRNWRRSRVLAEPTVWWW